MLTSGLVVTIGLGTDLVGEEGMVCGIHSSLVQVEGRLQLVFSFNNKDFSNQPEALDLLVELTE